MTRHATFVVFIVLGMFVSLLIALICPAVLVPLGVVYLGFYLCFITSIGWSALRHRSHGWISGLIFVGLLTSTPVWVFACIHLYQLYIGAA